MVNFFVFVVIIIVNKGCILWMSRVLERNAFIACCKNPLAVKRALKKMADFNMVLAISVHVNTVSHRRLKSFNIVEGALYI